MFRPKSLQGRLLLGIFACLTATLAVGGVLVHRVIDARLREEFDSGLTEKLRFYTTTMKLVSDSQAPVFKMGDAEWWRLSAPPNPDYVEFWYWPRDKFIFRLPSLQQKDLPLVPLRGGESVFTDLTLFGNTPVRMLTQAVYPSQESVVGKPIAVRIAVAKETKFLVEALNEVRWFLIKTGLLTTGALMLCARWIVRRAARHVHTLSHQIEAMPLVDSDERFALPGAPSELQPVVRRLNALMDRVGSAIEHERMFTSNAAHELRNPLAAIRSSVEVALSRTRKPEEYEETLEAVLESQNGMQRVVDHLLLLARLESGHKIHEFSMEAVSLSKLLRNAWRPSFDRASDRRLKVTWQVEEPGHDLLIPVALIGIVLRNLFDNATSYTPEGGQIRISAAVSGGTATIAVANTNPGITEANLDNTFSPFWRSDPNASGHRGNAGIGLALVRRIMDTMQGQAEARLEGDFLEYRLTFPAAAGPERRMISEKVS
ncbi:MAG: HAMP domain-containing sensor histidine kinase [Verrucomicrobiota bacterium]